MLKINIIKSRDKYIDPIIHNGALYVMVDQPKGFRGCVNCAFSSLPGCGDENIDRDDRIRLCNEVDSEKCFIRQVNGIDYQSQYKKIR